MKSPLVDTKNKSGELVKADDASRSDGKPHPDRLATKDGGLVGEVRDVIGLALAEADWYRKSPVARKSTLVGRPSIKGESGLLWTPDLVVRGKDPSENCCIIFCIDGSRTVGGEFDKVFAASQDLDLKTRLTMLVIKNQDGLLGRQARTKVSSYRDLFGLHEGGVEFINWDKDGRRYLVERLLVVASGMFPRRKGTRTVGQTLAALQQKSPELFGHKLTPGVNSKVIHLLQEIKERDPHLTFGTVVARAIRSRGVCNFSLPLMLDRMSDDDLANTLQEYLKNQAP